MALKISGNLYAFPLDFNMGFAICELVDFTKYSEFDGLVLYIYDYKISSIKVEEILGKIDMLSILFGPIPINKMPNTKGKGAWSLIGKNENSKHKTPIFKTTNALLSLYKLEQWQNIKGWYKVFNFNELSDVLPYEEVSNLELKVLYSMKNIQIRATMHFLLKSKQKINSFYNLTDHNINAIYLETINLQPSHVHK